MNTDLPTPGDWPPPELAPLAADVAPVCEAGKARALALEIVRLMLVAFSCGTDRQAASRAGMRWLFDGLAALSQWHARALDIESGREQSRPAAERLTLLNVVGAADRIASAANQRRKPGTWHGEAGIVYEIATALRRACECSALKRAYIELCERTKDDDALLEAHCIETFRSEYNYTARALLPLLIRDVRLTMAEQHVDASEIEAAIVAHGGRVS